MIGKQRGTAMKASSALGTRFGACMLLFGALAALTPSAAGAAPARFTVFDDDPFSVSAGPADASGSATWSRGGDPRDVRGSVSGTLNSSSGCARLQVSWLNAGNGTISSDSTKVCDGSDGFGFSFVSPALECVRVTLVAGRGSASKVLCAGGG